MRNSSNSSSNNRAKQGNQSPRQLHQEDENTSKDFQQVRSIELVNEEHEYISEFDQTGSGINPFKLIRN
jgi:hypothetical protein